jgi:hypothetical protein
VKAEERNALRFILEDDLYLLDADKPHYANSPEPQPAIETPEPVFNYLGSNKKSFLIVTYYDNEEHIAPDHLNALESVFGRIGYTRDDVAILNLNKHAADHAQLSDYFKPKILVMLGSNAIPNGLKPELNKIREHQGVKILYTFGFDEMMTSTENKKAFWEQMKTL